MPERLHFPSGSSNGGTGQDRQSIWVGFWLGILQLMLTVVFLATLWLLARPLAIVFLGIVLAAALSPLVKWLSQWLPRGIAVALVYLALVLVVVGIGLLIVPPLIEQVAALIESGPAIIDQIEDWIEMIPGVSLGELRTTLTSYLMSEGARLLTLPASLATLLVEGLLILFVSIYWLLQAPGLREFYLSLFPSGRGLQISDVVHDVGQAMGGFLRGTALDGLIVALLSWLGLTLIGVPFALPMAVFAGLMEFIPTLGPVLAAIPMLLVALANSPTQALIVLAFVLVLQQVESNLLLPIVMRSQTDAPPLLTLVAVFMGAAIGGLLGALIAIPLAAGLRVVVEQVLAPALRRRTGAEAA